MARNCNESETAAQLKDMTSGVVAGFFCKIIEYPFDTIKVLCQIHTNSNSASFSTYKIVHDVLFNEGLYRIYRGLSAPLLGSCVEHLITFSLWAKAERMLKTQYCTQELSILQTGYAGIFSGLGLAFWVSPMEFIKCQMQAPLTAKQFQYKTSQCLIYYVRHHPQQLITTGLLPTMLRESIGSFMYFVGYRSTCRILHMYTAAEKPNTNKRNNLGDVNPADWIIMSGGAVAGLSYWSLIYPLDLIKSLMQTQTIETQQTHGVQKSIWSLMNSRYKNHGFLSFYNGFSATIPRAILSNAIIFFLFERTRTALDKIFYYPGFVNQKIYE